VPDSSHYVIRGGREGRERLRVLGRVMHEGSTSLFDRLGVRRGLTCLDVGCGGGDATIELARRVGPEGRVVGVDIDETKLAAARSEAEQQGLDNVEFLAADVRDGLPSKGFDVVYSRFLLTHLSDPATAVRAFHHHILPGGRLGVEDIDFTGYFTYPPSRAFLRYHELYCAIVRRRGGDPDIGPRLPMLVKDAGFEGIGVNVVQPLAAEGDAKLINPLTMESISGPVLEDGLATRDEVDALVRELYEFAADPRTVAGMPRVVQVWATRGLIAG
jgi:SAM-dependent methyltransferase